MNYSRIYADFIASRQRLARPGYLEKHHIKPRALGGDDAPDNLIALTPEDHFFAHLLLAKIHGGRMWAPVAFMVGGSRKDYRPTISRKRYGWVSRAMAKAMSGQGAYQFDRARYELRHKDGREWSGLQSEMPGLGISKSLANMLLKGRVQTAAGWHLAERGGEVLGRKSGEAHAMHRKEVHHFVHVDGREFIGTQFGFHKETGVSKPTACKLARGAAKVWNGWHLKGTELPTTGRGQRWRKLLLAGGQRAT